MPPKAKAKKAEPETTKDDKEPEQTQRRSTRVAQKAADKEDVKNKKKVSDDELEEEKPKTNAKKGAKNGKGGNHKRSDSQDKQAKDEVEDKAATKKKVKTNDDDDDEDKPVNKKEPAKKEAAKKEAAKKEAAKKDVEEIKEVKKIVKGGAAVDDNCSLKDTYHVYNSGSKLYDATLNQSDVRNNNNKFYIIQVLQSDTNSNLFYVWNRWGRVGVKGQTSLKGPYNDAASAIADYESKLYDKSVKGDYKVLDIAYDNEEDAGNQDGLTQEEREKKDAEESKLPKQVKDLVRLIFDMKMINNQMKEIGYDIKKMPLGKLAKANIDRGYEILNELAEAIKKSKSRSVIETLSSDFYSYIPHDFGFQKMQAFILDSDKKVKDKLELLQTLEQIQIATKLISSGSNPDTNLIDQNYDKLQTKLTPLKPDDKYYKIIQEYTKNTHASTHSSYQIDIQDIFEVERQGESDRYTKDIPNKMLLWHGSRLTNYVGILSQGLRIAPPEAPVTGYMFGKGVYFADMVSKSANYCFTNRDNNTGLLMLCEVALGETNDLYQSNYYANNLPPGKSSTKGCGRTAPKKESFIVDNGVQIPVGKGEPTNLANTSLLYNEFIVYDINQIKIKYLLRCKFKYNH